MPLLRKQVFEKVSGPERLRDSDEVFYCETTNEIFSNYDDYFHRVMLISSMVWCCAVTGKPNLTYAEALESEKQARRQLKTFPAAVRGPILVVATHTKRSSFNELVEDVFGYVKERYFKGEEVDAVDPSGKTREATILEVIVPSNKTNSPVKTEKFRYRVAATDDRKPKEWTATAENVKRARSAAPREKCKLFLKMHVEQVGVVLKIKESSLKKFVTDEGITDEQIFLGNPPDFEQSKRLILAEAKKLRLEQEKKKASPKQEKPGPKKGAKASGSGAKDGKQQSISKYLNKSSDDAKPDKSAEMEKKKLAEEMERVRKEKAEKDALEKKRMEEQKAMLSQQVIVAIKKFNKIQEDLELSDQRVIPTPKPVSTIVDEKHISDFIFVLEFMTSFAELLSIKDKFAHGLSIDLFERALILREVNGPLSDIFQVLLSTLFSHQLEEENEVAVRYDLNADSGVRKINPILKKATKAAIWCETHYNTKLNELPMDSTTISELLRLHFLSSGALIEDKGAKWRYGMRGGYNSFDDPGIQLVIDHPHIFRALMSHTVFQLPVGDILKILKCLIDQLMTYSSVREMIEERVEKARAAKLQLISANVAKSKREAKLHSEKTAMKNDIKKKIIALEGTVDEKTALKKDLDDKMAEDVVKMEAEMERDVKLIVQDIDKLKESFFDYQIYLGSDRAHRSYWLFESLPGLFVEHDYTFCGNCLDKPTPHIPGLAACPEDQRKKFITQTIMNNKFSKDDKENDGIKPDMAIEKLILNGSAKLKGLIDQNKSSINGTSDESSSTSVKKEIANPSQEELLMCTANPKACPVHTNQFVYTKHWAFYNTAEEIEALIESLNARGLREKVLRDNLETEKELILNHIKDCPIEKLTVDPAERESILALIVSKSRKYDAPNFNHEPGTDPNIIFETNFRESVLDLESKITVGYLGKMKVQDRDEWREAIEQFGYKQLSEPLQWGQNRVMPFKETKEEPEEQDEGMENDEPDDLDSEKLLSHDNDPGYDLPDTLIIESEDGTALQDSDAVKEKVHSLAKALLQIEQCIDSKFLRHPFGPNKVIKDKANAAKALYRGQKNLARWEESLMRSTNYAQLFLHYNVLYDAIHWSSSAERRPCMICRRKGDPDMTLLCDECNRACHMYCLKPKLKQVPEGDWFCPKCKPEDYATKKQKRRKVFVAEAIEEEEMEEPVEEVEQKEDEDEEVSYKEEVDEDAIICKKCKIGGASAICSTCNSGYHTQCTKSLTDTPRKRWNCDKCSKKLSNLYNENPKKKKNKTSKKSKKKKVAVRLAASRAADDSFEKADDEPEEEEELNETEEIEAEEVVETSTKKRSAKRKISIEMEASENESDDEVLSVKAKKNRQSKNTSSKRSLSNGYHEDEKAESPPSKARRSTANTTVNDDLDSSSSRRARRTGDDLPLNNVVLYTLIDDIIKHPDSWPFDRPVSVKEVPDYYDIIKNPMDFAKIKSKLNMGEYTINEQMMNDVQLVFRNCDLYNTDETEIYVAGRNLERFVLQRSQELGLPFKPSDMLKNDNLPKNGTSLSTTTPKAALNGEKDRRDSTSSSGKRKSIKK